MIVYMQILFLCPILSLLSPIPANVLNSSKLQLILNWTCNFKAVYRTSLSLRNSVDLKIETTSAQLLYNKVLPSMTACSSIFAILKETYNTTKLKLLDNPMAKDDAHMICC